MELKKYKLGEIAEITAGGDAPKNYTKKQTADNSIPIYSNGIDNEGLYGYTNISKINRKAFTVSARGTIGVSFKRNMPYFPIVRLLSVIPKNNNFDLDYLYYASKLFKFKKDGSVQQQLTVPMLTEIEISIPPLESQQKIAAVLSALDDKIALNCRMNAKLEQMAKRLYDHWFVQFDFPNADGKPYKSSGGKMEYNEVLKREIPAGWEAKKLGELFTTNRGVSYSTKTITGYIGIPMINLASFSPDGSYKIDGIKTYTGEYTDEKVLKPFDLVMCNTQQTAIDFSKDIIGKALLVPDIFEGDITSSHHVNTLKVHDKKLKFYLYHLFNTDYFHAYISHYASGTNIMGLDFAGVENYSAVIPSEEILSKFADFTLNIEKKKSEIIRENKKLISLRDRLLPLLMNGQVEVR